MTIRKKSLTGTLGPNPEVEPGAVRSTAETVRRSEARAPRQALSAEDLALSKRTVSRILLAKSLFGR